MVTISRLFLVALSAASIFAQDFQPKRISVGVGAGAPGGDFSYQDAGVALAVNYAYRYTRFIQVDTGVVTSFNKDYRNYNGKFDTGLTTTTHFLVPIGGRILIPIRRGRLEPSVGLGGVYEYDHNAPGDKHRGGVYGLGGVSYALDSMQRHRLGVTVRYVNIMSAGRPHAQWYHVPGEYTYSWGL